MDHIRWWLAPQNPRIHYLFAGALVASGFHVGIMGSFVQMPLYLAIGFGAMGVLVIVQGIDVVRRQRRHEALMDVINAAKRQAVMEALAKDTMVRIADHFNDQYEAAGYGRPLTVDNPTFH